MRISDNYRYVCSVINVSHYKINISMDEVKQSREVPDLVTLKIPEDIREYLSNCTSKGERGWVQYEVRKLIRKAMEQGVAA